MSVNSASTVSNSGGLIQFSDLSGINTSSIVSALVQVAEEPITLLQNQVTQDQSKIAAWTDVGNQLTGLGTAVTNLQLQSNMTGNTVSSSSTSVATATATASATAGSYSLNVTQLATATSVQSTGQLAAAATGGTSVSALATQVTYGTFTINGTQINLSGGTAGQNDTTDTVQNVLDDINAQTTTTNVSAALNSNNQIVLTSTNGKPFQIGSSSDTSNFLTAANLTGAAQVLSGGQYTASSTSPITAVNTSNKLSSAGFATTPTGGQFMINGVTISYNTGQSLNTVLANINSSGAGVSAYYDSTTDKVDLTSTSTGTQAISLQEVGGDNLLTALNLSGATQNYGQNAQFTVNGGSTISSASNQVSTAIPNMTLNLAGTGSTTLTVAPDTQTAEKTINAFVTAYNTANADMNGYLAAPSSGSTTTGALEGDSDLQSIQQTLFNTSFTSVSGQPTGYSSLAQIGITTDQNTGNLEVDQSTLQAALSANPQAVYNLFNNATNGVATTLNNLINGNAETGAPGYLTPASSAPGSGGQIATEEKNYNNDITDLNQNITSMQQSVALYQQQLQQEFTSMETTIAGLQSTSGYLSSFASSLSSSSTSSSSTSTGG